MSRLVRYFPLILMTELFAMFVIPLLGSGPIWDKYSEQIMKPCETYWWTNLLYVNNIVPARSFDDKCMPWAWFIPCMVQISLFLPPLLFAAIKTQEKNFKLMRLLFASITLASWTMIATLTWYYDVGSIPITIYPAAGKSGYDADPNKLFYLDFEFYNKIYM